MKKTTARWPDATTTTRRPPAPMPGRLPVSDTTARTARSLYAEARRYESWARNIADGHTDSTDSNGRVWTLDEIHAHVWECRKAGNEAERAENALTAAAVRHATPEAVRMVRVPVVVYPPSEGGGRRVRVNGEILGTAYGPTDLLEFLRRAGLDPDEVDLEGPLIEWRGGGPDVW